jgi:hypothetical protein
MVRQHVETLDEGAVLDIGNLYPKVNSGQAVLCSYVGFSEVHLYAKAIPRRETKFTESRINHVQRRNEMPNF